MDDIKDKFDLQHFCELRQRGCPLRIEVAEVKEQLEGNRRAMELAAQLLDSRLEGMNEVREQLNRQAAETIRREEVMLMMEKSTETFSLQLESLRTIMSDMKERESKVILMLGVALLGLAGNLGLQLFMHISKH